MTREMTKKELLIMLKELVIVNPRKYTINPETGEYEYEPRIGDMGYMERFDDVVKAIADGDRPARREPCSPSCQGHVTHPCERCGQQW